jgi:hypothetical protein
VLLRAAPSGEPTCFAGRKSTPQNPAVYVFAGLVLVLMVGLVAAASLRNPALTIPFVLCTAVALFVFGSLENGGSELLRWLLVPVLAMSVMLLPRLKKK